VGENKNCRNQHRYSAWKQKKAKTTTTTTTTKQNKHENKQTAQKTT